MRRAPIFPRWIKTGSYSLFAVLFLLLLGYLTFRTKLLSVAHTSVSLEQCGKISCLIEGEVSYFVSSETMGRNLLLIREGDLKRSLMSRFPVIASVSVKKIFPNKIEVAVRGRPAVAAERFEGKDFLIDGTGNVFAVMEKATDLPYLIPSGGDGVVLGAKLDLSKEGTLLEVLSLVSERGISSVSIRRGEPQTLILTLSNGTEVWLNEEKDLAIQINLLGQILAQYTKTGQSLGKLDLRFDKPVIK